MVSNNTIGQLTSLNLRKNNTCGYKGLRWDNVCKKWQARIQINGKRFSIGYFFTLEEAINARHKKLTELLNINIIKPTINKNKELYRIPTTVLDLNSEIWKDIKDYERFYQISNLGRIKSLQRISSHGHQLEEKLIKQNNVKGYLYVTLNKNGQFKSCRVNRLVALAFIPNPNNFPDVNHKNLIKTENNVDNLEWMTKIDNIRHARANGSFTKKPPGNPKINISQVKEIRTLWLSKNYTQAKIAEIYNLAPNTVSLIVNNKRWKEII
jgi:NUMOD4 motif-containing protein